MCYIFFSRYGMSLSPGEQPSVRYQRTNPTHLQQPMYSLLRQLGKKRNVREKKPIRSKRTLEDHVRGALPRDLGRPGRAAARVKYATKWIWKKAKVTGQTDKNQEFTMPLLMRLCSCLVLWAIESCVTHEKWTRRLNISDQLWAWTTDVKNRRKVGENILAIK